MCRGKGRCLPCHSPGLGGLVLAIIVRIALFPIRNNKWGSKQATGWVMIAGNSGTAVHPGPPTVFQQWDWERMVVFIDRLVSCNRGRSVHS